MSTQKINYGSNILSNSIQASHYGGLLEGVESQAELDKNANATRRLFEQNLPVSLAEQFPRIVFGTIALSILLAAITAEIDCLRGAGYYWP
jgi:hypothetical protein